jgi:alpha-methylacyl-CoA racemase
MPKPGVLSGVRVVEIAGLAPAPFCGMLLADFGADVVVVDRLDGDGKPVQPLDSLRRGKRSIGVNLKLPDGRAVFADLARRADVLIEPFRPGKMEALGLGPDELLRVNPRLIYGRMTGFGQGGVPQVRDMAGHDINYLAIAGVLSSLAKDGENPHPPANLLGDFAGGGLMLAFGVLLALLERQRSGRGQVVDAAMLDGANYVSKFVWDAHAQGGWRNGPRAGDGAGQNMLDGGAPFYRAYRCRCGGFVAVGAIEREFYRELLDGLGLTGPDDRARLGPQMDRARWPAVHKLFEERFAARTRDEWAQVFMGRDACVTPVLSMNEATEFPHNQRRVRLRARACLSLSAGSRLSSSQLGTR